MTRIPLLLPLALFVCAAHGSAQTASTPVSVASFANPNFINGKIAQGMMFEIFGNSIVTAGLTLAPSFPLPTELAGSSVRVTVGGQVRDCIVVRTLRTLANDRVAAILPSDTPLGAGTLVVTFNGQSSPPVPIEVVAHSPGVFTLASSGSGPGVFTDPLTNQVNTVFNAFQPGDLVDVWMTGLGAAPFADNILPLLADLGYDVNVTVGGKPAADLFHGRSAGCCAGIDITRFTVPEGVAGCYVPVIISVNGIPSNITTMSIGPNRAPCSDGELGLSSDLLSQAQQTGSGSLGLISLDRTTVSFGAFPVPQTFEINTDGVDAGFNRYSFDQLLRIRGFANLTTIGACSVQQFVGEEFDDVDPFAAMATGLAAGQLTITGPGGAQAIPSDGVGSYSKLLSSGLPGIPGFPIVSEGSKNQSSGYLVPGDYTVTGTGGADVGPFNALISVPQKANTNLDSIELIPRSQALTITYSNTGEADFLLIFGLSVINAQTNPQGAIFFCQAAANTGSFDIPSEVLLLLPPSELISAAVVDEGADKDQTIPTGSLAIGLGSAESFSASGLDQGIITQSDTNVKTVQYQ